MININDIPKSKGPTKTDMSKRIEAEKVFTAFRAPE